MITEMNFKRKFNKRKASKKPNIRVGSVVDTTRGMGIVTYRNADDLEVALQSDILWCERWLMSINDVDLSNQEIDIESKLYKGAWSWIISYAHNQNIEYEQDKSKWYADNIPKLKNVTYSKRTVSTTFGTHDYMRLTLNGLFDFEVDVKYPSLDTASKLEYAYKLHSGELTTDDPYYITDMKYLTNKYGDLWGISKRLIKWEDVNYGLTLNWNEGERDWVMQEREKAMNKLK